MDGADVEGKPVGHQRYHERGPCELDLLLYLSVYHNSVHLHFRINDGSSNFLGILKDDLSRQIGELDLVLVVDERHGLTSSVLALDSV